MTDLPRTDYLVEGMTCGHCVEAVSREVRSVPGVENVTVDLGTGTVTVWGAADDEAVRSAVDEAGYAVRTS